MLLQVTRQLTIANYTNLTRMPVRTISQSCSLCQGKKILKQKQQRRNYRRKPVTQEPCSELGLKFKAYVENLILGTYAELKTVVERERLLSSNLPDFILELRGLCINNLELDPHHVEIQDRRVTVRFVRSQGTAMPSGSWRSGGLVSLVLDDPGGGFSQEAWRMVDGVVVDIDSNSLLVSVNSLNNWILDLVHGKQTLDHIKVIKRSEEKIYRNSIRSLKELVKQPVDFAKTPAARVIFETLFDMERSVEVAVTDQTLTVYNKCLLDDESKMSALSRCAECGPVTMIQGPPGTGKTTTLAAALLSSVVGGDRCLVVAPSHVACDALTQAMVAHWPGLALGPVVRLGQKLRLTSRRVERYLPENVAINDGLLESLTSELDLVRRQLIDSAHDKGDLLRLEASLVSRVQEEEWALEQRVVRDAKVVVCTIQTAMKSYILDLLQCGHFSVLYVDEAGFSLDCHLVPLLVRAKRLVMAGDHLQLPPVVFSQDGVDRGMAVSMLEKVAAKAPELVSMLRVQYRSHSVISQWSSDQFYTGGVSAHPDNASISLPAQVRDSTGLESGMVWLDTAGHHWSEDVEDEESISNIGEAILTLEMVTCLVSAGVAPRDIGVITPYWAQVSLIRSLLWGQDTLRRVEVRTVDGFQGKEKEVIILSMVRSNDNNDVGFLSESRRINVSVTRARRCCVIVGDSHTLSHDQCLNSLYKYCQQLGSVKNVNDL